MIVRCTARTDSPAAPLAAPFPDEVLQYYRPLLARLASQAGAPAPRTLGLTSCTAGEGVSTVAAQLAWAAASAGTTRTLLVDANLARPTGHTFFAVEACPGLVDVLLDGAAPAEVIQPTARANLFVLAAGQSAGRLAQAQEALAQESALANLRADFDLVILDLPASASSPLTARLGGLLDGVLLLIGAEGPRRDVVQREKELLAGAGVPLLGAVLNRRRHYLPGWLRRCL